MQLTSFRHAQSTMNENPIYIGGFSEKVPLSSLGMRQARALGIRLMNEINDGIIQFPDFVHCSTAVRTQETARIVFEILGRKVDLIIDKRLNELDQGEWEGRLRSEIYTPEQCQILTESKGSFRPPGGESQNDVSDRIQDWQVSLDDANHWAFSHGVSMRCLIGRLLGMPNGSTWMHETANTGIHELGKTKDGWILVRFNDHSHLNFIS